MNNYDMLVAQFPLKPIKSEEELDKALLLVNKLVDKGDLDKDEEDYLSVLSNLVEAYEEVHYPILEPSLNYFIEYLLEDCKGMQVNDLDDDIKPLISSIMKGDINIISIGDLKKVSSFFNVKPSVIIDLI